MADMSTTSRSHAEILFGDAPSDTAPLQRTATTSSAKSHAQILFPDAEQGLDLEDNMARIADVEGISTAQQAEELREFATMARQFGLERHEARRLHEVYTKRRLEGDTDHWASQTQHWATASRRALREHYGPAQAESLLQSLDALADTHPGLQRILEGGVGAHPEVVAMFAEHIRRGR